jgi:hypothetical protein
VSHALCSWLVVALPVMDRSSCGNDSRRCTVTAGSGTRGRRATRR